MDSFEQFEQLAFNLGLAVLFILMWLAVNDVLNKSSVPKSGRILVWSVLFFGCVGFVAKGLIEFFWKAKGVG